MLKLDKTAEKDTKNKIVITTVHSSKGLEFETVFVHGVADNNFPHSRTDKDSKEEMDEEQRILYVAITRAKRTLYLTMFQTSKVDYYNSPGLDEESKPLLPGCTSPFLTGLDGITDLVNVVIKKRENYQFSE